MKNEDSNYFIVTSKISKIEYPPNSAKQSKFHERLIKVEITRKDQIPFSQTFGSLQKDRTQKDGASDVNQKLLKKSINLTSSFEIPQKKDQTQDEPYTKMQVHMKSNFYTNNNSQNTINKKKVIQSPKIKRQLKPVEEIQNKSEIYDEQILPVNESPKIIFRRSPKKDNKFLQNRPYFSTSQETVESNFQKMNEYYLHLSGLQSSSSSSEDPLHSDIDEEEEIEDFDQDLKSSYYQSKYNSQFSNTKNKYTFSSSQLDTNVSPNKNKQNSYYENRKRNKAKEETKINQTNKVSNNTQKYGNNKQTKSNPQVNKINKTQYIEIDSTTDNEIYSSDNFISKTPNSARKKINNHEKSYKNDTKQNTKQINKNVYSPDNENYSSDIIIENKVINKRQNLQISPRHYKRDTKQLEKIDSSSNVYINKTPDSKQRKINNRENLQTNITKINKKQFYKIVSSSDNENYSSDNINLNKVNNTHQSSHPNTKYNIKENKQLEKFLSSSDNENYSSDNFTNTNSNQKKTKNRQSSQNITKPAKEISSDNKNYTSDNFILNLSDEQQTNTKHNEQSEKNDSSSDVFINSTQQKIINHQNLQIRPKHKERNTNQSEKIDSSSDNENYSSNPNLNQKKINIQQNSYNGNDKQVKQILSSDNENYSSNNFIPKHNENKIIKNQQNPQKNGTKFKEIQLNQNDYSSDNNKEYPSAITLTIDNSINKNNKNEQHLNLTESDFNEQATTKKTKKNYQFNSNIEKNEQKIENSINQRTEIKINSPTKQENTLTISPIKQIYDDYEDDTLAEFIELEESVKNESKLMFIPFENVKPSTIKKEKSISISPNFSKIMIIIRSFIKKTEEIREISMILTKYKRNHFVALLDKIQKPNNLIGIYTMKENKNLLKLIWGNTQKQILKDEIDGSYCYNIAKGQYIDLKNQFDQKIDVVTLK